MGERVTKRMTVEEFFEWQQHQDRNYELVDGVPVLPIKSMTGATERHDAVTVNAILLLGAQLRGKPCRPRTDDKSIRISNSQTRRPDVMVECGSPSMSSMEADEPRVVIEVLSPTTTRYDRFRKLEEYKTVAAIKVILLIDTERPRVTVWRRDGASWGNSEVAGLDGVIELPEIEARLPLAGLYEGLPFDEDAAG